MQNKKKIFFTVIVFTLVFIAVSILKAKAAAGDDVTGWLGGWSQNAALNFSGLGWISTNNLNCDLDNNGFKDAACGGNNTTTAIANYGMNIPMGSGDVTGYVWSENVGWVSFQALDLVGCPSGTCSARRVGNNLEGWARILSVKTASAAGNSGGWLGWIKLNGTNYSVTVPASGNGPLGNYAWSDELGWIDFSKATIASVASPTSYLCIPTTDPCAGKCNQQDLPWQVNCMDSSINASVDKANCIATGVGDCADRTKTCDACPAEPMKWIEQ